MSQIRLYLDEDTIDKAFIKALRDYSIGQQLRGLLKLVAAHSDAKMVNQLIFLSVYIGES